MRRGIVVTCLVSAACGSSSPVSPSSTNSAATQSIVNSTLTQALTQASLGITTVIGDPGTELTSTMACPNGGTITATSTWPPLTEGGIVVLVPRSTAMRMNFNDCRSRDVTVHGDPYITTVIDHAPVAGLVAWSTMTIKMSGGIRFESASTQGRARYDCTHVMAVQYDGVAAPETAMTSTGTITWEQPLGTVTTRSCGA